MSCTGEAHTESLRNQRQLSLAYGVATSIRGFCEELIKRLYWTKADSCWEEGGLLDFFLIEQWGLCFLPLEIQLVSKERTSNPLLTKTEENAALAAFPEFEDNFAVKAMKVPWRRHFQC
ncbi:uncharacterized protein LOC144612903 [Panthera onca]